ncbi:HNH endonuclease [Salininema proteolyticum]|uniref:HNH endonuclease n=1 Tax=Salininema proteolyticum TaxID=1607685 RepID=A0ABV8TUC0_9ACTN
MIRPRHRTTVQQYPGHRARADAERAAHHQSYVSGSLVLNQSYEPLCVVSVKRAVVLLLTGKAEAVATGEGVFHSESLRLPAPSVVRLKRYVRIPRQLSSSPSRRGVFLRDDWTCVYCAGTAETIDHVIPRSRGGTHTWDNVVAACADCNQRKGSRMLQEIGWHLPRRPKPPAHWQLRGFRTGRRPHPTWEPWLPRFSES